MASKATTGIKSKHAAIAEATAKASTSVAAATPADKDSKVQSSGRERNDAASNSKPKSNSVIATLLSVIVALVSFLLGLGTPPFRIWVNEYPYRRDLGRASVGELHRGLGTGGTGNNHVTPRPLYSCTDQFLEEYFHERFVPGFHILCMDIVDKHTLNVRAYEGGMQQKMTQLSWVGPVSWTVFKMELTDALKLRSTNDEMHQEWALFAPEGQRVLDETALEQEVGLLTTSMASDFGMLLLFQGGQFLWPGVRVGFQRHINLYSIMPPGSPEYRDKNSTVTLETLSLVPLVLSVKGFLTSEECEHIQNEATPTMKYSDVVLMDHDKGRPSSDFRTSQTTFLAAEDDVLLDIDYRTASLVRIPRNHQEPVQVLRYGQTERYTSHHDYFSPELYQQDKRTLRLINNGRRNRMVTVFWYLSDVPQGGHTVFPRADGAREMSFDDCESGLKVKPETGKVIIFYSMTSDGTTDPASLHGACPVKEGIKWAANKWVWNEPMTYVDP